MVGMHLGTPAILIPRKVGDLEGTFFVPDYQRGYRWGEDEVRRLLDDIKEAGTSKYYLQPVVVKPMEDGRWELVDGQQRLTTLYLILRSIRNYLPQSQLRYTLTYETRPGSAAYLDDPQEQASQGNIDYFHMYQAFTVVQAWFEEQENATLAAINLFQALTSTVYVIWYEAPQEPEFDSRALFTRLNVGRIPLTDAELVKASLLSRIEREHETAAQWDSFERDLWSSEVWAFATGSSTGGATRIELLLDTIADSISGERPQHRAPFQTFETLRPHIVGRPAGTVGPGDRPALTGPWLVRRPQSLPQDRVPGRIRARLLLRPRRACSGQRQVGLRGRPRCAHHKEPRPSLARGRRADVRQHQDGTGSTADERRDGTPQSSTRPSAIRSARMRAGSGPWSTSTRRTPKASTRSSSGRRG